jgi:hypothetical protein
MPARRAFTTKLPWLIAIIAPPALIAYLIARYGVDVPYWDDWAMGDFLVKAHAGNASFADFVAIHNEGRLVVPRVLALASAALTGWDKRSLMFTSLAFATATAACLYSLALRTIGQSARWPCALAGVFIFSILQFLNWLWAFQVALFIPAACLAVAMWIITSRISGNTKIVAAALLAFVATYSFTNGMSLWLLLFPLLWITPGVPRRLLAIIWPTAIAIALFLYFRHFHRADWTPTWGAALSRPAQVLQYMLVFVGMPLGWGTLPASQAICIFAGLLLLILFAGAIGYLWLRRRDRDLLSRAAPWLLLALYALMSAAATSIGRAVGVPFDRQKLRYVTFAIHLPIALIFLSALIAADLRQRKPALTRAIQRGRMVLGAIMLIAVALMISPCLGLIRTFYSLHLQAKGGLQFIQLGELESVQVKLDPNVRGMLVPRTLALDEAGLFHPRVHPFLNIHDFAGASDQICGAIERISRGVDGITLSGFAILPGRREPADDVLIAVDEPDGTSRVIALTDNFADRDDVAAIVAKAYRRSGWQITIPADRVPPDTKLSAWSYDAKSAKAFRLGELH